MNSGISFWEKITHQFIFPAGYNKLSVGRSGNAWTHLEF